MTFERVIHLPRSVMSLCSAFKSFSSSSSPPSHSPFVPLLIFSPLSFRPTQTLTVILKAGDLRLDLGPR